MNISGESYYEYTQQSLPFHAITAKETADRNLHPGKLSGKDKKKSPEIETIIATFGGTIVNDFNDELFTFNVT